MASRLKGDWPIYLALIVFTALVFARVRQFEFVDYDDLDYVVDNARVASGLSSANASWAFSHAYEHTGGPLTWMSYMADASRAGMNAGAFHLTNLLLHILSVCLLYAVMTRLTGARAPSALVAALFAMHPLHVESVAWIAERKDVLSGVFTWLTIGAYAAYVRKGGWWRYGLVVLAFAAGLLSKPIVITLPLVLLVLDVWPLSRFSRQAIVEKIPLFVLAAIAGALTISAQRSLGAMSSLETVSFAMRAQTATVAYAWYLLKTIWPVNLGAIYPLPASMPLPAVAASALALAALSWWAWTLRRSHAWLLTGWLWYVITLVPVSGLFQTGAHARADRNTYLSLVGVAIMIAWGLDWVAKRWPSWRTAVVAGALVFTGVCAAVAWQQVEHWRNSETLFRRAIAVTQANYIAETGLATTLRRRGDVDEPIALYQRALQTAPRHAAARGGLGEALTAQGRYEAAVYELTRAVELDPTSVEFLINLGTALHRAGRDREAVRAFRRAASLMPDRGDAHSGLGAALGSAGEFDEAARELAEAIRLNPRSANAHYNLGMVMIQLQRPNEAVAALRDAARLQPADAQLRNNLGGALLAAGRPAEAVVELTEAVKLAPDVAEFQRNLQLAREAARRR